METQTWKKYVAGGAGKPVTVGDLRRLVEALDDDHVRDEQAVLVSNLLGIGLQLLTCHVIVAMNTEVG